VRICSGFFSTKITVLHTQKHAYASALDNYLNDRAVFINDSERVANIKCLYGIPLYTHVIHIQLINILDTRHAKFLRIIADQKQTRGNVCLLVISTSISSLWYSLHEESFKKLLRDSSPLNNLYSYMIHDLCFFLKTKRLEDIKSNLQCALCFLFLAFYLLLYCLLFYFFVFLLEIKINDFRKRTRNTKNTIVDKMQRKKIRDKK